MPASFDFIANGPKSGSQVSKKVKKKRKTECEEKVTKANI